MFKGKVCFPVWYVVAIIIYFVIDITYTIYKFI
jgi:hypothetical protein